MLRERSFPKRTTRLLKLGGLFWLEDWRGGQDSGGGGREESRRVVRATLLNRLPVVRVLFLKKGDPTLMSCHAILIAPAKSQSSSSGGPKVGCIYSLIFRLSIRILDSEGTGIQGYSRIG